MTDIEVQRLAVGFGMVSLMILVLGSLLAGATLITAFVRGISGAVIFGGMAWFLGSLLKKEETGEELLGEMQEEEPPKGEHIDEAV